VIRFYLAAAIALALVPGHGLLAQLVRVVVRHFIGGAL
jgi:hypothetical protein